MSYLELYGWCTLVALGLSALIVVIHLLLGEW